MLRPTDHALMHQQLYPTTEPDFHGQSIVKRAHLHASRAVHPFAKKKIIKLCSIDEGMELMSNVSIGVTVIHGRGES